MDIIEPENIYGEIRKLISRSKIRFQIVAPSPKMLEYKNILVALNEYRLYNGFTSTVFVGGLTMMEKELINLVDMQIIEAESIETTVFMNESEAIVYLPSPLIEDSDVEGKFAWLPTNAYDDFAWKLHMYVSKRIC